jgi:Zinc finger, C2H2 type
MKRYFSVPGVPGKLDNSDSGLALSAADVARQRGGGGTVDRISSYKHRCHYCQKGFASHSALVIHMRSHTG